MQHLPSSNGNNIFSATNQKFKKSALLSKYQQQYRLFLLVFSLNWCIGLAVQAQDVLVGLTSIGGSQNEGTAFTIKSDGSGFTVRHRFAISGQIPYGDLIKNNDGYFYGMTSRGGAYGYGTIFKMTANGTVTILHSFNNTVSGANPQGSLKKASDGNLYGMTYKGGAYNYGTIFKITPGGTLTVLRSLDYTNDGGYPYENLIQASDGNFYGLTLGGGSTGNGTIFKITLGGDYTVLRSFVSATDGANPYGSLVQGADGNLYGTTSVGGTNNQGTIFRISLSGTFTVRRHLNYTTDGAFPTGNNLIVGADGNFYGMMYQGGTFGYGTLFKMTPGGTYTVLKNLNYTADGGYPKGSLVQNTDGNFYGIMQSGGSVGYGTLFKMTPGGTYTVLKNLAYTDGGNAQGSLVRNSTDGNFYGMTSFGGATDGGTIFRLTPGGTFTRLVQFPEASKGIRPIGNLIQARDGNFYGTTLTGGLMKAVPSLSFAVVLLPG
ncbi:hypothetical protein AHMF7616_03173 [Adhaeribacter pallidiroseus]|uniref:Uncharacterized protein n=2 Tax=Adhaeribacter pallidiroseus TaxID=2072847 RepID=A0A369QNY8_9BACT|nr:hypothetical protein AHMF7616_03173 [Adhaeribacter pallidiroseus]